jgi:hypothetical protein
MSLGGDQKECPIPHGTKEPLLLILGDMPPKEHWSSPSHVLGWLQCTVPISRQFSYYPRQRKGQLGSGTVEEGGAHRKRLPALL